MYVVVMYADEHSSLKVIFVVEYLRICDKISCLCWEEYYWDCRCADLLILLQIRQNYHKKEDTLIVV
jgi:hypothetical protein